MKSFFSISLSTLFFLSLNTFGNFQLLFQHSSASSQWTAEGRSVDTLQIFNNKLYMGYGDYGKNTGPIDIITYDLSTKRLSHEFTMGTEAIEIFRPIGKKLYVPAADPAYIVAPHDFAIKDENGNWEGFSPLNAFHIYDMFSFKNKLWSVGSSGWNANLWSSTDDGKSWRVERDIAPLNLDPARQDFSRFYFGGILNNRLYIQPKDFWSGTQRASLVYDGKTWTKGPMLFGSGRELGSKFLNFKNLLIYKSGASNRRSRFYYFDGVTARIAKMNGQEFGIYDYAISDNKKEVYVLKTDGEIYKTKNFKKWIRIAGMNNNKGRSLAINKNNLYIGTSESTVFLYSISDSILQLRRQGCVQKRPERPSDTFHFH